MNFSTLKNDYFYKGKEVILSDKRKVDEPKKVLLSLPNELESELANMKDCLDASLSSEDQISIDITKSEDGRKFDITLSSAAWKSNLEAFNVNIVDSTLNDLLKINTTKEKVKFGFHIYRNPFNPVYMVSNNDAHLYTEQDEETGGFKIEGEQ